MDTERLFIEAITQLKLRAPNAFKGQVEIPPSGGDRSWENDEPGWIRYLEDRITAADWNQLSAHYRKRVDNLYLEEYGQDAGVPPHNRLLNLRCRALIQALAELSGTSE